MVKTNSKTFQCLACKIIFDTPPGVSLPDACPYCGSSKYQQLHKTPEELEEMAVGQKKPKRVLHD